MFDFEYRTPTDHVGRDLDAEAVRAERAGGHTQEARQGVLRAARAGMSSILFQMWWHFKLNCKLELFINV